MQYTRKYHTTTAENMSTDWLGPRIYRPSLEEVLRGAISPSAPHVHYITHFRYPSDGGFVSYLKKFVRMGNLQARTTNWCPSIRAHGELTFSNGHVTQLRRAGLFGAAARSDPHDQGRAAGCRRCLPASGLLNLRPREHRRES